MDPARVSECTNETSPGAFDDLSEARSLVVHERPCPGLGKDDASSPTAQLIRFRLRVGRRATSHSRGRSDPPKALESGYGFKPILIAVTTREAIYSLVKSLIDRGHASSSDQPMVAVLPKRLLGNLHTARYG